MAAKALATKPATAEYVVSKVDTLVNWARKVSHWTVGGAGVRQKEDDSNPVNCGWLRKQGWLGCSKFVRL
jgi:hypothetical protein